VELLERAAEVAALAEAHAAAARGEGRVVVVTGEPGIGKTFLVTSFVRTLAREGRVLWGTCDDVAIPRPLGPLRDLSGGVSPALEDALAEGAGPHEVQSLLLAELELPPRPTVLALEDVHWADEATLDVITVLGRRIDGIPTMLVLTFRGGEVSAGHPLHTALGAVPAGASTFLELAPLSRRAVASLAGEDAEEVYAVTGGNPFYVTEVLAAGPGSELPPSVAAAVLGRAARLDDAARRLVELVSVVPTRADTAVLDALMPEWPAAAEEPERRQLLEVHPRFVRFRHELARNAIRSSVPVARRRRLHAEILAALLRLDADPADIVQHAQAAGDEDALAEYAPLAARRAAALESNREAYSHYRRAAEFADRRPPPERAALFEELAHAAYTVGRLEEAFAALEQAIARFRETGDGAAVGRCTRVLSRYHWYAGDGDAARSSARQAIAILEPLGESRELARAYSALSQLAMLAEEDDEALDWADRALRLAERLHDAQTRAHALVNIGSVKLQLDPEETSTLLEAHAVADAAGERHEAVRALLNLGYSLLGWVRPGPAAAQIERAVTYAREHEVDTLASYAATTAAWLALRAGDWAAAERAARAELASGGTVTQLLASTVLADLAVRRGDADARERLDELATEADRAVELQRTVPVLELETVWALLHGATMPVSRFRAVLERHGHRPGFDGIRAAAWGRVAGVQAHADPRGSAPYAAMLRGDWAAAAAAFGEAGWLFERGLFLSLLDDERPLREALAVGRELRAEPLARRVRRRLRELGLTVPRGPRAATRQNPAGLTARQLEVLALVAGGLTNAEIAERLVVSERTAEHHVSAVLAKLGVASRRDAARRAVELGVRSRSGAGADAGATR
jgi:DNA-binding CsgD family transcriptional regulator/tetratricopeptide (TPR) repeat protein